MIGYNTEAIVNCEISIYANFQALFPLLHK